MCPAYGDAGRSTSIATLGGLTQLTWTPPRPAPSSTSPVSVATTDSPCSTAIRRMTSCSVSGFSLVLSRKRPLRELLARERRSAGRRRARDTPGAAGRRARPSPHRPRRESGNRPRPRRPADGSRPPSARRPARCRSSTGLDRERGHPECQRQRPRRQVVDLVVQPADLAVELPLAERFTHVKPHVEQRPGKPPGRLGDADVITPRRHRPLLGCALDAPLRLDCGRRP